MTGLLLLAHGSADPAAAAGVRALVQDMHAVRPHTDAVACFLDHAEPDVAGGLQRLKAGPVVVVPLLLSDAYHARVDVAAAVAAARSAGRPAVASSVLGGHPLLLELAAARLSGVGPTDPVVLAAAGSSDVESNRATEAFAAQLAATRGGSVTVGYAATGTPDVPAAIHRSGAGIVLRWLLSPGRFAEQIARQAAAAGIPVTDVLVGHPLLTALVLARYDEARASG